MPGGTQLQARSVRARPEEPVALAPPRGHEGPASSHAPVPAPPSPPSPRPGRSRRLFLRAAFALGVIGGTATALLPVLRADPRSAGLPHADAAGPQAEPAERAGPAELFDEMYGGRHIQGTATDVRIDGRPLHVMRRADGGYLSVVNHYESFTTALATARAAVDDLGGAQLSLAGPASH